MCLGESQISKRQVEEMKKESQRRFCIAASMLLAFLLWTLAIQFVDVQAVGPQESSVGFATINLFVHNLTGVHMSLYTITDWLGLVPLAFVIGFALLGLTQWIQRKHLLEVDYNILLLGGFYIIVMAAYFLFETFVVNYRPVLIDGILEASYPSSTTMLVMCVMPTTIIQFHSRIKNDVLKGYVTSAITAFIIFTVVGRVLSGVHWITDIIGGALLSAGLVIMYRAVISLDAR